MNEKIDEKKELCSVDKEIFKLKNGLNTLQKCVDDLRAKLYSILPLDNDASGPSQDCLETKGKLDSELFNMNQNLEWAIENISDMKENLTTKGVFFK